MSQEEPNISKKVITRYPPSPTGKLHLGQVRTALFNYLFAKQNEGKIILRWEDTDKARSKKEYELEMFEGISWAGISFDKVYHQSERILVYRKYLEKMLEDGTAYFSEASTASEFNEGIEEDAENETPDVNDDSVMRVIRFKNPNKEISFHDLVRGEIKVDTTELGDFIIARSIEEPLYHLAVVVDDFEMGITHIIRGEDGIYNTPRQILLQEAIGATRPEYCHIPFVLGEDKKKLSKRHGATSIQEFKDKGILPSALINYLALLGWNPGTEKEIFTMDELIKEFDLKKVQKGGAIFSEEKLLWFNREHIKLLPEEALKKKILENISEETQKLPGWSKERFEKIVPEISERIQTFSEIKEMEKNGDLEYFFKNPIINRELLMPRGKDALTDTQALKKIVKNIVSELESIDEGNWNKEYIKNHLWDFATEKGRGNVLWPMRAALSGKDKSPDPFTLAGIIGKEETLTRLNFAIGVF